MPPVPEFSKRAGSALLDVGEWQGNLAVFDPKERADTLVITSGPLQGMPLFLEKRDGKQALVLKHSQTGYVAVRP